MKQQDQTERFSWTIRGNWIFRVYIYINNRWHVWNLIVCYVIISPYKFLRIILTQYVTAVEWGFAEGCHLRYMVVIYDSHWRLLVHAERLNITDELPVNPRRFQSIHWMLFKYSVYNFDSGHNIRSNVFSLFLLLKVDNLCYTIFFSRFHLSGFFSGEEWIFVTGKLRGVEGGPKPIVRIYKTTF